MSDTDPLIYFGLDGAPRSARFDDIYYSLDGGLEESIAVFLTGCGLPQAWLGQNHFSVLELGFGTGLNVLALIDLWLKNRAENAQLHIFTIEAFLMQPNEAEAALRNFPEIEHLAQKLLARWPKTRTGFDYLDFSEWGVSITVAQMDVLKAIMAFGGKADAVFLDGFSPRLNPDMWSEAVMLLIASKCHSGTKLATFTVAGSVRKALTGAGFTVKKCQGFGKKKERLEATLLGSDIGKQSLPRPSRLAIIGAGIAGACLAQQAQSEGIRVTLFDETGPASGASGNRAGLVTPRIDSGDNKASRFMADAYNHAVNYYENHCGSAITGKGVFQIANDARSEARFTKMVEHNGYPKGSFKIFAKGEVADTPDSSGLSIVTALHINPKRVVETLLNNIEIIKAKIEAIENRRVVAKNGSIYDQFDAIILANGEGILDIVSHQDLRPVHGQVEVALGEVSPQSAYSWGGYCIPLSDGFVFGSTHERDKRGNNATPEGSARNNLILGQALPDMASKLDTVKIISRASTRVMSLDIMPIIGEVSPNVWMLTALGSRGFCTAPLLAKWLLCLLKGQGIDAHTDVINSVHIKRYLRHPFILRSS